MTATLLVVDDNPDNLTVLGELLAPHFRVLAANNGARALELAGAGQQPDLVLLDVMMPDMDGYAVLAALRAAPETRDLPVIFVTAMAGSGEEVRGLALGAVDYITKPLVGPVVLARVRTQLALKQARDRLNDYNAALEAEAARRVEEHLLTQDAAIMALARLAGMRDAETGSHLLRTQAYVRTLAEALRDHPRFRDALDAATIDLLAKSAPLHDIGKVGIPDRILRKPAPLTPREWAVMRTHAALGAAAIADAEAELARPVPFLACAKQIARHHHERWDGSGYPDGLAGEAIPVAARLMALADVFDALTTPRAYKEARSPDAARVHIVAERGRHFDPDVVDAFLAEFDDFCAIANRHRDVAADGTGETAA
ncbi:MAG: response regulator [Gammaproteobacteria bacterium]